MMMTSRLWCYLSPRAVLAMCVLIDQGLDGDLAFAVLEKLLPEEDMWEL